MATALMLGIAWILVTQKQSARQIKAAQQARYDSEERLCLFIEHAPVALAMFDRSTLSPSNRVFAGWAKFHMKRGS